MTDVTREEFTHAIRSIEETGVTFQYGYLTHNAHIHIVAKVNNEDIYMDIDTSEENEDGTVASMRIRTGEGESIFKDHVRSIGATLIDFENLLSVLTE